MMRYVIETTNEGNNSNVWNTIDSLHKKGLIKVLDKGDPIQNMKENLRKVRESLDALKSAGIDRELMVAFIKHKSSSLSQRDINDVLELQQSFFKKFEGAKK